MARELEPIAQSIDEVTLDWLKVKVSNVVPVEIAETLQAKVYRNEVWGWLTHELTARVLGERLPDARVVETGRFVFEVPASPWQQFKTDHAAAWWLRWLVKRRPPRIRRHVRNGTLEVDVSRYWTYPEARIPPDRFGNPVRVAMLKWDASWRE